MLLIVGVLVVLGSVSGGYMMAGGHMALLMQPSEFVIILGAAAGSLLISTSPKVVLKLVGQCKGLLSSGLSQNDYADLLSMLYQIFRVSQQSGVMALEEHFEKPEQSQGLALDRFGFRHRDLKDPARGLFRSAIRAAQGGWFEPNQTSDRSRVTPEILDHQFNS